jgi:hypothetical protein
MVRGTLAQRTTWYVVRWHVVRTVRGTRYVLLLPCYVLRATWYRSYYRVTWLLCATVLPGYVLPCYVLPCY